MEYIRLALKQLCRTMESLPSELQEVYKRHDKNVSQPNYDELRTVLLVVMRHFGQVFFVLDALDECTFDQRQEVCDFLLNMANTTSASTTTSASSTNQGAVKLFVTSRKESDIERAFQRKSIPTIEINATDVDSDIEVYVKAQIELRLEDQSLRLRDMGLKNKILSVLTSKAGGMYVPSYIKSEVP